MPLWGQNNDPAVVSTNKPKWLTGTKLKKSQNKANTYGVSKAEVANTGRGVSPGWVTAQRGTGPVTRVDVVVLTPGAFTVNNNVSVVFATNAGGQSANGIAQFTNGNLTSILVDAGGANYTNAPAVTVTGGNGNTTASQLTAIMGGRVGRTNYENLVWIKNMASDDPANDNVIFGP
jgi:UDP-N-acetylmuramoylalanine-D-glutamate ligase